MGENICIIFLKARTQYRSLKHKRTAPSRRELVGGREQVPGRREFVVDDPGELLADVPRQLNRHVQVLHAMPQVNLHVLAGTGERVLHLHGAPVPFPEPDHHVAVQRVVLALLPDMLL
jgi:hypothetical protein